VEEGSISGTGWMLVGITGEVKGYGRGTMSCPARPSRHCLLPDHASRTSRFLSGCRERVVGGSGRNEPGCRERV